MISAPRLSSSPSLRMNRKNGTTSAMSGTTRVLRMK